MTSLFQQSTSHSSVLSSNIRATYSYGVNISHPIPDSSTHYSDILDTKATQIRLRCSQVEVATNILRSSRTTYPSQAPGFNINLLVGSVLFIFLVFCVLLFALFVFNWVSISIVQYCLSHRVLSNVYFNLSVVIFFSIIFKHSCVNEYHCMSIQSLQNILAHYTNTIYLKEPQLKYCHDLLLNTSLSIKPVRSTLLTSYKRTQIDRMDIWKSVTSYCVRCQGPTI